MKSLGLLLSILLTADYTGANPTIPANLQDDPTTPANLLDQSDNDVYVDINNDTVTTLSEKDKLKGESMPNTLDGSPSYEGGKDPEEGPYAQGDELKQQEDVNARAAIVDQYPDWFSRRWPKEGGLVKVPYVMSTYFKDHEKGMISKAFTELEKNTCIRIVPKSDDNKPYIHYIRGTGCNSYIGRQRLTEGTKGQQVSLGGGCLSKVGTAIHETMHALGFLHEQSREDRDKYVTVRFLNVESKFKHNFEKEKHVLKDIKYDYDSVMHYNAKAFNRIPLLKTIVTKGGEAIGQREYLSPLDVKKINTLYNCPDITATHACGKLRCITKNEYCSSGECKDLRGTGDMCTGSRQCKSKNCGICWFRLCCKAP